MPTMYSSPAIKAGLAKLRRYSITKKADDISGKGMESSFEQSFSSIAHAYLRERAPSLLDYEVGFQLIDRSEDGNKAVAVMGFKVGPMWLYAPVFFLDGDLKGHELLYVKNQDLFVPLKENWLNYLLNRRPHVLGKPVSRDLQSQGVMPPNIYQIKYTPSKYASANPRFPAWVNDFLPVMARAFLGEVDTKIGSEDLLQVVKEAGVPAGKVLINTLASYPQLMNGIEKFYGFDKVSATMAELSEEEARMNSVLGNKNKRLHSPPQTMILDPKRQGSTEVNAEPGDSLSKSGGLHIITMGQSMFGPLGAGKDLEVGEKEKLMKGKVVIRDVRVDSEITRAYAVEKPKNLFTPGESGLYDVLVSPNTFAKCAIFMSPYTAKKRMETALLVRLDDKAWLHTHPAEMWVKHQYTRAEFEEWAADLPKSDDLGTGLQILVSPSGQQATCPFRIGRETVDGGLRAYEAFFMCTPRKNHPGSRVFDFETFNHEPLLRKGDYTSSPGHDMLILTGHKSKGFRVAGSELYVPAGCGCIELDQPICGCGVDSEPPPILTLGNLPDLYMGIVQNAGSQIDVSFQNGKYSIKKASFEPEAAVVHLVRDHGLREAAAREILEETKKEGNNTYFFKYARPQSPYPPLDDAPTSPSMPEMISTTDPMSGYLMPSQEPYEWNVPIPGLASQLTDRSALDPRTPTPLVGISPGPDTGAMQSANQAAQQGQKEIFDTSMIGSLIKNLRPDTIVSKHLGHLMQTMSRIGKLMMNMYWNRDAWEERYGKEEFSPLEDLHRDSFDRLGDLVLNLHEREVKPDTNEGVLPDLSTPDESYR